MCACGMDIGTCFLVSAKQDSNNQVQIKSVRDAFIDMENDPQVRNMMKMSGVNFIEAEDKLYIVGDPAIVMANIFNKEARRPLSKGIISPGETEAEKILMIMLKNILGKVRVENETCYFSVPAAPIDRETDIVYHQAMFSKLISTLGYKPISLNEAAAIVYSNCGKEQFSALAISFGAGMVNVCLMYQTMVGMAFSISRGGDFIDENAARATGTTASRIMSIKEKGINLLDPTEGDKKTFREREAINIYYKSLVFYALDMIKAEFLKREGSIELPKSIPIVLSGGTSLAKNFLEFFETGFKAVKDKFPIPVSEIRMASDPLNAVAEGLLVAALNHDEGQV
jgi:hypothetical protein